MPNSSSSERGSRKRHALVLAAVLVVALLASGVATVQGNANREAQARKTPLALAFESDPQPWLANPREASEFEAALVGGRLRSVAIAGGGNLALYTDLDGQRMSSRLLDCGAGCTHPLLARLGELSRATATA